MIKIYSNQNIEGESVIPSPQQLETNEQEWWMVYDVETLNVLVAPQQCSGFTNSPLTMVVSDTEEELEQYIIDNNLINPRDEIVYDDVSGVEEEFI